MRYVVEIISPTLTGYECLSRATVDGENPTAIRNKATQLLNIWAKHGATGAHVYTEDGQPSMEVNLLPIKGEHC